MTTEKLMKENERLKEVIEKYREETNSLNQTIRNQMQIIANLHNATIRDFTEKLKEHYPHSPTVCNTIDRVAFESMIKPKEGIIK